MEDQLEAMRPSQTWPISATLIPVFLIPGYEAHERRLRLSLDLAIVLLILLLPSTGIVMSLLHASTLLGARSIQLPHVRVSRLDLHHLFSFRPTYSMLKSSLLQASTLLTCAVSLPEACFSSLPVYPRASSSNS